MNCFQLIARLYVSPDFLTDACWRERRAVVLVLVPFASSLASDRKMMPFQQISFKRGIKKTALRKCPKPMAWKICIQVDIIWLINEEKDAEREQILAVLSLWKDKSWNPLTKHVSSHGSVFLRKHVCSANNPLVCRGVTFCCSAWHFIIYIMRRSWNKDFSHSFSYAPNYYSLLFLVKSGRALPLFSGIPG